MKNPNNQTLKYHNNINLGFKGGATGISPVAKQGKRLVFQFWQQHANNFIDNLLHVLKEGLFGSTLSAREFDSKHWKGQCIEHVSLFKQFYYYYFKSL